MPQGERRGSDVDLHDFTYDGRVTDGYLSGGLGQLTDGVEGHHNFRLDPDGWGHKGYEWVGWRNDSSERDRAPGLVEIVFEFERVRNFTAVRFHANNMFSKDVRVFRRAVLWFRYVAIGWSFRAFSRPAAVWSLGVHVATGRQSESRGVSYERRPRVTEQYLKLYVRFFYTRSFIHQ